MFSEAGAVHADFLLDCGLEKSLREWDPAVANAKPILVKEED